MNRIKTIKAALAALLAALMALAVFPLSALPARAAERSAAASTWSVPEGYNAQDYNKCVAFLEQEDANGVKNGQKLNPDYDPNDPETWVVDTFDAYDNDKMYTYFSREDFRYEFPTSWLVYDTVTIGIGWTRDYENEYISDGLKHVNSIIIPGLFDLYYVFDCENPYLSDEDDETDWNLAGDMNFSGMERLATFFVHAVYTDDYYNATTTIDLSYCQNLSAIGCVGCVIKRLNITGDENIFWLNCAVTGIKNGLNLSELDDENPFLDFLDITDAWLPSIEFPSIGINCLQMYGCGFETLDLSPLTYLYWFNLETWMDWELDFEGLQQINYLDRVCRVEGPNCYIKEIEYRYDYIDEILCYDSIQAAGEVSSAFIGWFDGNGELITEEDTLYFDEGATGEFIARFRSDSESDTELPYNTNDYNKVASFLARYDDHGYSNGENLNPFYDLNDPDTWCNPMNGEPYFRWIPVDDELRLNAVTLNGTGVFGELDLSDCTELTALSLNDNRITGLNVNGCTKLETVYCENNSITTLWIYSFTALKELDCSDNDIDTINLFGCTALEKLDCSNNWIARLYVCDSPLLKTLECDSNNLIMLDVTGCSALEELNCAGNNLDFIAYLSDCTALKKLNCSDNAFVELDVSSFASLEELDVSSCTALESLNCSNDNLTALNVTGCSALEVLDCSFNDLTELDVSQNTALRSLNCCSNSLAEIDLSNNPYLNCDLILAEGNGYVGLNDGSIYAYPLNDAVFMGFYIDSGTLLSEGEWSNADEAYRYSIDTDAIGTIIALFVDSSQYNAHDYAKCVAFLEQTDENGVKNGKKINKNYDPNDPETWLRDDGQDSGGFFFYPFSGFGYEGEQYRLNAVFINGFDLVGALDLSGCSRLMDVWCFDNRLTEIDLSGTPIDCRVTTEGDGYVGFGIVDNDNWGIHAQALYNTGFCGFYDIYGGWIAPVEGCEYVCRCSGGEVVARFEYSETTWETEWWIPFGYEPNDYEKCVAFLEQKDDSGVKNGEKLNPDYHPAYPKTWKQLNSYQPQFFEWQLVSAKDSGNDDWEEPKGIYKVHKLKSVTLRLNGKLAGTLDLSGCTMLEKLDCQNHELDALNVSDCTALETIMCQKNRLSELNVSNATALKYLYCFNNELSELDVSGNPSLLHLICNGNELTELDVSGNPMLEWLDCYDNELSELDVSQNPNLKELVCEDLCVNELDLSNNPELAFERITAEGPGTIGYADGRRIEVISYGYLQTVNKRYLYAYPQEGARFEGFYDENGELLSMGSWKEEYQAYAYFISPSDPAEGAVTARFVEESAVFGDIDGDGELSAMDALLLLRHCTGESGGQSGDLSNADMNGDGEINLMDALLLLRMVVEQ